MGRKEVNKYEGGRVGFHYFVRALKIRFDGVNILVNVDELICLLLEFNSRFSSELFSLKNLEMK